MFLRTRSTISRPRGSRLAPLLATINGALQALADVLLQPVVFLAAIAFLFGGSNTQIASFATVTIAAWSLSPMVLALIHRITSRNDIVTGVVAVIRILAVLMLGHAALQVDDLSTARFVGLLVVGYIVYQGSSALASQATSSGAGGTNLGFASRRTYRNRRIIVLIAAAIGSLVAWNVLRADMAFQRAVEQILLLAVLAAIAATWFLLLLPRRRTARAPGDGPWRGLAGAFRVAAFRRFAAYKILLAATAAVDPFLIVHGFRELAFEVEYLGLALLAFSAGHAFGAFLWPRWIARSGPRVPFQLAALFRFALLLWVIAVPGLLTNSLYTERYDDGVAAMRGFALGFVLLGLAGSVGTAANQRYLMDLTKPESLPSATFATNMLMAISGFGPLVVARLLDDYDLNHILWAAAVCAALALFASGLLVESTVRVRTPVGSWRSTRQATNGA